MAASVSLPLSLIAILARGRALPRLEIIIQFIELLIYFTTVALRSNSDFETFIAITLFSYRLFIFQDNDKISHINSRSLTQISLLIHVYGIPKKRITKNIQEDILKKRFINTPWNIKSICIWNFDRKIALRNRLMAKFTPFRFRSSRRYPNV